MSSDDETETELRRRNSSDTLDSPNINDHHPNNRGNRSSGRPRVDKTDPQWLARRREQVAKASRKVRQKRKDEIHTLREENEALRKERADLLTSIEELSNTLTVDRDPLQDMENRLLKAQIRQHSLFLRSILDSIEFQLPANDTINREIVAQTGDIAETESLRMLQRSQEGQGEWSQGFRVGPPRLPPGTVAIVRHEARSDGGRNLRIDICVWQETPDLPVFGMHDTDFAIRSVRDIYVELWSNAALFKAVFRSPPASSQTSSSSSNNNGSTTTTRQLITDPNATIEFHKLPEFSFVEADGGWKRDTQHMVETLSDGQVFDWVFLNSVREEGMAKSLLWCGEKVEGMMPVNPLDPSAGSTSKSQSTKKQRRDVPVGIVPCARGIRTITCHGGLDGGLAAGAISANGVRVVHHFVESVYIWEDTMLTIDDSTRAFPCGRATVLVSLPGDFRISNVGTARNFVDDHGQVTEQFIDIMATYATLMLTAGAATGHAPPVVAPSPLASAAQELLLKQRLGS